MMAQPKAARARATNGLGRGRKEESCRVATLSPGNLDGMITWVSELDGAHGGAGWMEMEGGRERAVSAWSRARQSGGWERGRSKETGSEREASR